LFAFPVTFKPKHLALGLFVAELMVFVLGEAMGNGLPFDAYPSSAHLGGMMAGWLAYRYFQRQSHGAVRASSSHGSSRRVDHATPEADQADAPVLTEAQNRALLKIEVDRILDKINSAGLGALTVAEKRLLDEAKDLLSRR
ncbi:MAG: hypothetical protein NTV51_12815, partial [Verrucomicrobia bacterium]|nr:hypothetical protein [Verrucomicrobiota bacterium]